MQTNQEQKKLTCLLTKPGNFSKIIFEQCIHILTAVTVTYAENEIHYESWTSRKFVNVILLLWFNPSWNLSTAQLLAHFTSSTSVAMWKKKLKRTKKKLEEKMQISKTHRFIWRQFNRTEKDGKIITITTKIKSNN